MGMDEPHAPQGFFAYGIICELWNKNLPFVAYNDKDDFPETVYENTDLAPYIKTDLDEPPRKVVCDELVPWDLRLIELFNSFYVAGL